MDLKNREAQAPIARYSEVSRIGGEAYLAIAAEGKRCWRLWTKKTLRDQVGTM
jgi:hypothetical protein